jgi:hypothetical protein
VKRHTASEAIFPLLICGAILFGCIQETVQDARKGMWKSFAFSFTVTLVWTSVIGYLMFDALSRWMKRRRLAQKR